MRDSDKGGKSRPTRRTKLIVTIAKSMTLQIQVSKVKK